MGSGLCTLLSEWCSDWLSFSQRVWSRKHVAFASRSSFSMGLVGQWPHARCTLDIRRSAWMFKTKQREDAADSLKCMTCKNDLLIPVVLTMRYEKWCKITGKRVRLTFQIFKAEVARQQLNENEVKIINGLLEELHGIWRPCYFQ